MCEKSKQCFNKSISLPLNKIDKEEVKFTSERNNCKGCKICGDVLEDEILHQSEAAETLEITESLIVPSVFGKENWSEGCCWVHSQIKGNHESLANQILIYQ